MLKSLIILSTIVYKFDKKETSRLSSDYYTGFIYITVN